jgi:hypothetical protein
MQRFDELSQSSLAIYCHLLNILLIVFSKISAPCREILNFFVKSILFLLFSSVPVNHKHSANSKINQIETCHVSLDAQEGQRKQNLLLIKQVSFD